MSTGERDPFRHRLFIEVIAEGLYFDELAERVLGNRRYAPHFLLGTSIGIGYALRFPLLLREPWRFSTSASIIGGLLIGLFGAVYMRDGYADAVERLRIEDRPDEYDPERFATIVPFRLQVAIHVVALLLIYYEAFVVLGFTTLIEAGGAAPELFRHFVAYPLAYLPIVIDVGVMFVGVQFLLPRRLKRADFELFFYDPRDMGGFAPIGQLLKRSYYVYTAGLLAYFGYSYIPVIFSDVIDAPYDPGPLVTVFFTVAWLFGICSIAYSMWTVHRLMADKKEQKLRELEDELRGVIENPYDISESEVSDEAALDRISRRLEQVRATKEYPTTFTMWSQILISVLLPQALNVAFQVAG